MNTWSNPGGPLAAPAGGWKRESLNPRTVSPCQSDSSQQASSIPGAVQKCMHAETVPHVDEDRLIQIPVRAYSGTLLLVHSVLKDEFDMFLKRRGIGERVATGLRQPPRLPRRSGSATTPRARNPRQHYLDTLGSWLARVARRVADKLVRSFTVVNQFCQRLSCVFRPSRCALACWCAGLGRDTQRMHHHFQGSAARCPQLVRYGHRLAA
jgi:hypothetical protein